MATPINVIIKYVGPVVEDVVREGSNICKVFVPTGCYADTPVFTDGYPVGAEEQEYGKSVYATNVEGRGMLPGLRPMAHTTVPFAQFERAAIAACEAKKNGTENTGITFEIEGYEQELYWVQMAGSMAAEGFFCKVGEKTFGTDPNADAASAE